MDSFQEKLMNYLYMREKQLSLVSRADAGLNLTEETIDNARLAGQLGEIQSMIKYFSNAKIPDAKEN